MGSVQSKTIFENLRASVLHGVVQNPGQCTVPNNFDNLRASVFNDPPMFTIYGRFFQVTPGHGWSRSVTGEQRPRLK